jgi:hypothetical protein
MKETFVLSFSIVRTGITDSYNTIGIASTVVDKNYELLDSFEMGCYFNKNYGEYDTNFDEKYKKTFWEDKQELLNKLSYSGDLDPFEQEGEMIRGFMKFVLKWESKAQETGFILEVATDNPAINAGFINIMIYEHTNMYPLPFTTDGNSRILLDVVSQQKGVLSTLCTWSVDPSRYSSIIRKIYNVTEDITKYKTVDYLLDTVYSIAKDQQILNNIRNNVLKYTVDAFNKLAKDIRLEIQEEIEKLKMELAEFEEVVEL